MEGSSPGGDKGERVMTVLPRILAAALATGSAIAPAAQYPYPYPQPYAQQPYPYPQQPYPDQSYPTESYPTQQYPADQSGGATGAPAPLTARVQPVTRGEPLN